MIEICIIKCATVWKSFGTTELEESKSVTGKEIDSCSTCIQGEINSNVLSEKRALLCLIASCVLNVSATRVQMFTKLKAISI